MVWVLRVSSELWRSGVVGFLFVRVVLKFSLAKFNVLFYLDDVLEKIGRGDGSRSLVVRGWGLRVVGGVFLGVDLFCFDCVVFV